MEKESGEVLRSYICGLSVKKPKGPANSFLYFCKTNTKVVRSKSPDLNFKEVMKQNAEDWSKMTHEEK